MRRVPVRRAKLAIALGGAALTLGTVGVGCFDRSICEYAICGDGGAGGAMMKVSTTDATTASVSSTSSGGGPCNPKALPAGASIGAQCGLFVVPGATGGDGSQAKPYGKLADALVGNTGGEPIYVCATGAPIVESIELVAAERIHGALTCGDWKTASTKTVWTAPPNEVPLTLEHTVNATVRGFVIEAPAGSGFDPNTLQGGSSIAIIADGAGGLLEDIDIVTNAGAKGGDGMSSVGAAPGRDDLPAAFDGNVGGGCDATGGLAKVFNMCPLGNSTQGGKGGNGGSLTGSNGSAGSPNLGAGEPDGSPGFGDDGNAAWTCVDDGGAGDDGHAGSDGSPGDGGAGLGTVDDDGWNAPMADGGGNGQNAQGGGGGGGRAKLADACATAGASGGSGGAGGCGGAGGGAGGAGGASIGLITIDALVTLSNVTVTVGAGGDGGDGGDGQLGGAGGFGANGGGSACRGGDGGEGGDGGGGGGGIGGPSYGIASVGTAPAFDIAKVMIASTPSNGGAGGVSGFPGDPGDAAAFQAFP